MTNIQKKAHNYLKDPTEKKKRYSLDAESLISFLKSYEYDVDYVKTWQEYAERLKEDEDMKKSDVHMKIVITNDGKVTTAKLYDDKEVVAKATSSCHDADNFDVIRGAEIALSRLKDGLTKTPWERFRDGEFVVSVPMHRIPEFLKEVVNNLGTDGFKWASGHNILDWNDYETWITRASVRFTSTMSCITNERGLCQCMSHNKKSISYSDFLDMFDD